ncbi:MAG: transposase [Pseudomonadota bacterium]
MPEYRRWHKPGGVYFFTVNLADRRQRLLVEHIDRLRASIAKVRAAHPFEIEAAVILPDHLHMMWRLPEGDSDYSTRWRLIKSGFVRGLAVPGRQRESLARKGERGIWQRRFYEHVVRDETDYANHVDYIHFNPVKHGHASRPVDWPHSSIHRFIRKGVLDEKWGVGCDPTVKGMDLD